MIYVNGRFLSRQATGVERYASEILSHLGCQLCILQPGNPLHGLRGHLWEQVTLPRLLPSGQTLWSPANTGPLAARRHVLTLFDLSPLENPAWYRPDFSLWYRLLIPSLARRARRVVVPSEYVRHKVMQRFHLPPQRVVVVPGGVDGVQFHPAAAAASPAGGSGYLLFVGSLQPRKNLDLLLEAWKSIQAEFPDHWLVLAGARGRAFARWEPQPGLERVTLPGYLPENQLAGTYACAAALVLPSLDEGFGLPVLEGMACGTPVVVARAGALPEVAGDAGLYFDPQDIQGLAAALRQILGDPALQAKMKTAGIERARQYSWQSAADKMRAVLLECQTNLN